MFKFESTPFRRDIGGEILFFGYPLFGGWLPYVGIRYNKLLGHPKMPDGIYRTFTLEWFMYTSMYIIQEDNNDTDYHA